MPTSSFRPTTAVDRPIELPVEAAAATLPGVPFVFRHALQDHPLLSIPALAALADCLSVDTAIVERFGDPSFIGPHQPGGRGSDRPSAGDLIRAIASNGCWADLRHIEQVPAYRDLVEKVLGTVLTEFPRLERDSVSRHGFIFMTAPRKRTPVHTDPEYNFLLQLKGTKTVRLAALTSLTPRQLADWESQRGYEGGYRRPLDEPRGMEAFVIEPGMGLFIPAFTIHAVYNGDEVSVSLSLTCRTRGTEREYLSHAIKRQLRKLGLLRPGHVGASGRESDHRRRRPA